MKNLPIESCQLFNLVTQLAEDSHVAIYSGVLSICTGCRDLHVNFDLNHGNYMVYIGVPGSRYKISFTDPLHVLPLIHFCLDCAKSQHELFQYRDYHSAIVNHHLRLSVDDFVVWPCGTWCYRSELPQMIHKSDDFEIIPAFSDDWHKFTHALLVPDQVEADGGHSS